MRGCEAFLGFGDKGEAHAACANKTKGSALTWDLGGGEVMKGVCAERRGKMVFVLRSYELNG